jgi:hypothetical protein
VQDATISVPPSVPYRWNNGAHDIDETVANAPLIAMAWVHEGGTPPIISDDDYEAAQTGASGDSPTDAQNAAWEAARSKATVIANYKQYANWYLILVACQQVRDLTDANIQNFCKMCSSRPLPSKTSSFLSFWGSQQSALVEETTLRERFEKNKFFEYHTTGSSTPKLCFEALNETSGLDLFTSDEEDEIEEALENEHDLEAAREIDAITLVKVRAIHEASGTLPDTWYMGSKAVARFSGKKYSALVKYLQAIFKRQTNTDGIDDMDLDTLAKNLKLLLETFGGYDESSDDSRDGANAPRITNEAVDANLNVPADIADV